MIKDFSITLAVLLIIFMPAAHAQQYDSQSVSSHYNQYSPSDINSPYSQYNQYSVEDINNPYSQINQYTPNNFSSPLVEKELKYSPGLIPEETAAKAAKAARKAREAAEDALVSSFFKPKKSIPIFFYLLVLSFLAVGLTIYILFGVLKK